MRDSPLTCSQAPKSRQRWTVRLLAEKLVELKISECVSPMTVQRSLKNELQPHLSWCWKIPPDGDAAFVAAIEEMLVVYHLPHDPPFPVVWMDESNKQLVGRGARANCCRARSRPDHGLRVCA